MAMFLSAVFVAVLSISGLTDACSCWPWPPDVKETFCNKDFVIKVEILNETRVLDVPAGVNADPEEVYTENFAKYWYDINVLDTYK